MTCNCNYGQLPLTSQCTSCNASCSTGTCSSINNVANQKQMWHQVRVPASLYTMNAAALANTQLISNKLAWNQSSDKLLKSIQTAYHPTRGSSTRRTLTSLKPGSCAPGGKGVDIKHNSYDRYLNKLKGGTIAASQNTNVINNPNMLYGNKKRAYGIIAVNPANCC
uniref:Uncharacterized protein n=1 Tax=viral metagenome TaxID=1070528 RepID=A0A6C0HH06_9ZZZZ